MAFPKTETTTGGGIDLIGLRGWSRLYSDRSAALPATSVTVAPDGKFAADNRKGRNSAVGCRNRVAEGQGIGAGAAGIGGIWYRRH